MLTQKTVSLAIQLIHLNVSTALTITRLYLHALDLQLFKSLKTASRANFILIHNVAYVLMDITSISMDSALLALIIV